MFSFRRLIVYILAKELIKTIYKVTAKFPEFEKFALTSQLNRAAVSIASNIAEGTSRNSSKDKVHFINIAYCSLMEVVCQIDIAFELEYLEKEAYDDLITRSNDLAIRLNNFQKSIKNCK